MNEIEGFNDRKILFLLIHKENKTKSDLKRIDKLIKAYPDHESDKYKELESDLRTKKFIKYVDLDPDSPRQSASGAVIYKDPFGNDRYKPVTSKSGENALKGRFFKSEIAEQARIKRHSRLDATFKWVAIIGGVLGFFSFFRQFFCF